MDRADSELKGLLLCCVCESMTLIQCSFLIWQIGNVRIKFNFPRRYFLASAMVLDPGAQGLARPQISKQAGTTKPLRKEADTKSSDRNGIRGHSSLSTPQPEAPLRTISQTSGALGCGLKVTRAPAGAPSLVGNRQCSWMRRSESSFNVNNTGSNHSRARIRNATSLPHIARHIPQEPPPVKSPCLLVALRPMNVDKEKEAFFKSNYTYNPQFEYSEPLSTSIMSKYSEASDRFIEQVGTALNLGFWRFHTYVLCQAILMPTPGIL